MAENLFAKVWALDFAAHRWMVDGEETGFTTPNVKFVSLAIARSSLRNGACWASQATLSKDTGVSKQTVSRCIAELESAGWLKRIAQSRADGGRSTDRMWMTLPEVVFGAEIVPPRPQRFFAGGHQDMDQDGPPPPTVDGQAPAPRGAPPSKESGQEVNNPSEVEVKEVKTGAKTPPAEGPDVPTAVRLIWERASKAGRERSSKADIETALKAALARGHAMQRILTGMGSYFASADATKDDGAYQKGAHRILSKDRWESFLDDAAARTDRGEAAPDAATLQAAEDLGTIDKPTPKLQAVWMGLFAQGMTWPPERGPQPGRLGCRVADEIQLAHGVQPYKPSPQAGAGLTPPAPKPDSPPPADVEDDAGAAFD